MDEPKEPETPPTVLEDLTEAPVIKRYEVTVERQFIVYAPDADIAGAQVLTYIGFRPKPGKEIDESAPCKIVEVKELPALLDEPKSGIIDRAPSRETRS